MTLRYPVAYNPKTRIEGDVAFSTENLILDGYKNIRPMFDSRTNIKNGDIITNVIENLNSRINWIKTDIIDKGYQLEPATKNTLGGFKVGENITMNEEYLNLTKDNVIDALGYVPAKASDIVNNNYTVFKRSGPGAKSGLVPAPPSVEGSTKYLREDGTWAVPEGNSSIKVMEGASETKDGKSGLVPKPTVGQQDFYLRGDGTWDRPEGRKVDTELNNTTRAYVVGTTSSSDSNGTLIFDNNIYIDSEIGKLRVKSIELGSGIILS